jgi:lipopolysaccharide export system permease protein
MVFIMSAYISPWTELRIQQLNIEARQQTDISKYRPGVFESSADGRNVLYFRDYNKQEKFMRDVFIRLQKKGDSREEIIMAEKAKQELESERAEQVLHLYDGVRYQGKVGQSDYSIITFSYYQMRIPDPDVKFVNTTKKSQPFGSLLKSNNPYIKAEMHWRLSSPISLLLLAILAIPLSYSSPRQGRYAKLFTAIMLFAVYAGMLGMARVWLEQGKVPASLGFWWAHGLVLILALYLITKSNGRGWQSDYKRIKAKINHATA